MKDKGHFWLSMSKSLLRVIGCVLGLCAMPSDIMYGVGLVLIFFMIAEAVGIIEEMVDKR